MNTHQRNLSLVRCLACWGLALLVPGLGNAQHHFINVPSGADCVSQEYRKPVLTPGIYDALWMSWNVPSTEGNPSSGWYGGPVHDVGNNRTLVQYSFWPSSLAFPSGAVQRFVFAGTNMSWHVSIGEGTVGGISGYWPLFQTNQWYRFVVRYWQPADGTPHVGYQGMWMRDPVTANWYHQGTVQYAFGATGVDGLSGFQEDFTGAGAAHRADYRNAYYHRSGLWQAARQFQSDGFNGDLELIEGASAVFSQSWGRDTNALPANLRGTSGLTLTMANQPAAPVFDPLVIANASATFAGAQLVVPWQLPQTSSPQLAYKIEVFTNSNYTGLPAVAFQDNDPEARQKLLAIPGVGTPFVRLTLSDIFFNTNAPVLLAAGGATLAPATNVAGTVGGLAYQYYQAGSGVNWTNLPNFSSLVPALQGAGSSVDLTPRQRRSNYAFSFSGFLNAPADGLYAFTLCAGHGAKLWLDGALIVNGDGVRNSTDGGSGWVGLQAGLHSINVQYFQGADTSLLDGLGLYYEGPGFAKTEIPAGAFRRTPGPSEPTIAITSPTADAAVPNSNPGLSALVTTNGATVSSVRFYLTDFYSYFYRPNQGVDYYLGQDATAPYALNTMVWSASTNLVRARLVYNGTNTLDSAPVRFATTNSTLAPWYWSPLEMHNYPSGASVQGNTCTLLGDGMNFLSRRVTGDCTLVGRLSSLTPNTAGPDGVAPDGDWRAGLILRGTTNATIGQPLGDGGSGGTRFAALFSTVGGGTYFEDDTMRNGNGDANRWSSNLGGGNRWYKLQRVGDLFISSVSMDGVNWTIANSNTLSGFGTTIHAGLFIHAVQSQNPNLHRASFDSFSLTGSNVLGPASVAISPQTNAVIGGLPATFVASVIGPVPTGYQWQLNGTNLPAATNATLTLGRVTPNDLGLYTVIASGITSAPATLLITAPAGSGVWTNLGGGSWAASNNWSGGLIAGGTDAAADFSTLSLNLNPTVTLNGARTVGTLVFDDLNPATKHNWTLTTGTGGPLTLAVSSGTPGLAVQNGTNLITAVLAGTQGLSKTGAGHLTLGGASTFTGTASVNAGTLEVQSKSGDTPYAVAQGASLKIGYSTGGGYANTGLTINGQGASATTGFYLQGGKNYNASGQIVLLSAPTTIRQYGTGLANIGTFDINGTGLWCTAAASGSALDTNVQLISSGYGMSVQIDPGANTTTGDLTVNGPLNVGSQGLYKRGAGSLALKGTATTGHTALNLQAGTVLCGVANCLGTKAAVPISSGAVLRLNGFNQSVATLNAAAGSTLIFGGTNTLTVSTSPVLAGTLQMAIAKVTAPASSKLLVGSGTLTYGGALAVTQLGPNPPAAGDTFVLFSASNYAGAFTSVSLPALPNGLLWNTNSLATNGTLTLSTNGLSQWSGAGANGNWSTPENWTGSLPVNGQSLTFQGTLRPSNTNNLLAAVGQVVFKNGGFALAGSPVTLQWGLVNEAGTNTWALRSTLAAPQSLVASNGALNVSGAITNAGFDLTLDGPGRLILAGVLSGAGGLVKTGLGRATLSATNTFTGPATVSNGTLLVNGALPAASVVTVTAGGTLGGTGVVNGSATVAPGGTLALGDNGLGTLTVSNTLTLAGNTLMELSKSGATLTNDLLNVSTPLTYGGTLTVTNLGTNAFANGDTFKLFNAPGYAGAFASQDLPALPSNLAWNLSKLASNGTLTIVALPVITHQPQSMIVTNGSAASFTVGANGSLPLAYQWRKNGTNLAGATASRLNFPSTTPNDAAAYTVVVTNPYGAATSQVATLTVYTRPLEISRAAMTAEHTFSLAGPGATNQPYVLWASEDLGSAALWEPQATNLPDLTGWYQFIDPQATNHPRRFYRIQAP